MAKLDVMARPRPIYLQFPAWSAQGVQEKVHSVRWAMVRVEDPGASGASRTFPPPSFCNERNSSGTLLLSVQSRLGCGERDERNERGRPECRVSPSVRILRARRNRGDGREDNSIRADGVVG